MFRRPAVIIGGTGSIGRNLAKILSPNQQVIVTGRNEEKLQKTVQGTNCDILLHPDLREEDSLEIIIEGLERKLLTEEFDMYYTTSTVRGGEMSFLERLEVDAFAPKKLAIHFPKARLSYSTTAAIFSHTGLPEYHDYSMSKMIGDSEMRELQSKGYQIQLFYITRITDSEAHNDEKQGKAWGFACHNSWYLAEKLVKNPNRKVLYGDSLALLLSLFPRGIAQTFHK